MRILAVDTSSKNCSVAIVEVDENKNYNIIAFENSDDEKTHSQKLMPIIDKVFKEHNLTLKDMDLLACCVGPGSFTGIRIGIATMKAFADVTNIKTVSVTSLESLSYNIEEDGIIIPIIDCKNNNVYSAIFSRENNTYKQIGENIADNIDNAIRLYKANVENKNITFVGDGSILYKDLLTSKLSNKLIFSNKNIQSSISLAKCAYDKYLEGLYGDSNNLSPLYLRKSQAERALVEK